MDPTEQFLEGVKLFGLAKQLEVAQETNRLLRENSSSSSRSLSDRPGYRTRCPICNQPGESDPQRIYVKCANCQNIDVGKGATSKGGGTRATAKGVPVGPEIKCRQCDYKGPLKLMLFGLCYSCSEEQRKANQLAERKVQMIAAKAVRKAARESARAERAAIIKEAIVENRNGIFLGIGLLFWAAICVAFGVFYFR